MKPQDLKPRKHFSYELAQLLLSCIRFLRKSHNMKYVFLFLLCLTAFAQTTHTTHTAREYFNELRDANAFNHYGDEYVCFPDEDKGGFVVIARSKDIDKMVAANNKGKKPKFLGDVLVVQPYYKGVSSGTQIFEKADKDSEEEWSLEVKSPKWHGKIVYMVNWITGRYRMLIYSLERSDTIPSNEVSGKCELIHPWSPPPQ